MFLGGQFSGGKVVSFQAEKTNITIIDPSDSFNTNNINGIPCTYIKPTIDGSLSFKENSFDLVASFGVLHHVPNVSFVLNEFSRCLRLGAIALIREPIVSMGANKEKV